MTILEAVRGVDSALDDPCAYERKISWLSRVDAGLHRRLSMPGQEPHYDADTDPTTVLLASGPYEGLYDACLRAHALELMGDTAGADRAGAAFRRLVEQFAAGYRRSHTPAASHIQYPGRRGW